MEEEINYNQINDLINNIPDNFNILEETVDVDVQKDYFESSKKLNFVTEISEIVSLSEQLYNDNDNTDTEQLKTILLKLACTDSVEAFRTLEKYVQVAKPDIKDWAILAFQQSRMMLQSSLLDEQQVFISTGLGGKNNKLRYLFIIPFNYDEGKDLSSLQKSVLEKELKYFAEQYDAEFESIEFSKRFATALILCPLKAPVADMVQDLLNECNQYGNFVSDDIIITNIKKYNHDEIAEILENYEKDNNR